MFSRPYNIEFCLILQTNLMLSQEQPNKFDLSRYLTEPVPWLCFRPGRMVIKKQKTD